MERKSYREGFEDAIELVLNILRERGLLTDEVERAVLEVLASVKEDKLLELKKDLGLLYHYKS